jgi:hypothetical protein
LIEGQQAKRFADLTLHRSDLQFAGSCLAELMNVPPDQTVIREALWRSAIVYFIKCFGESARFRLSIARIFKPEGPGAMIVFDHFRQLRNKHFIHDENSYAQSIPAAFLNDGTKP